MRITERHKGLAKEALEIINTTTKNKRLTSSNYSAVRACMPPKVFNLFESWVAPDTLQTKHLKAIYSNHICMHCNSRLCYNHGVTKAVCLDCLAAGVDPKPYTTQKRVSTCLDTYGETNPSKAPAVLARIKEAFTSKYGEGVTNAMHLPEVRERITTSLRATVRERNQTRIDNCLAQTGFDHWLKVPGAKDHYKSLVKAKTGFTNSMLNPTVRQKHAQKMVALKEIGFWKEVYKKVQATCLERYSVDNIFKDVDFMTTARKLATGYSWPLQNPKALANFAQTCLKRYGETHHMKNPEVFDKVMKATHRRKFYTLI